MNETLSLSNGTYLISLDESSQERKQSSIIQTAGANGTTTTWVPRVDEDGNPSVTGRAPEREDLVRLAQLHNDYFDLLYELVRQDSFNRLAETLNKDCTDNESTFKCLRVVEEAVLTERIPKRLYLVTG